MRIGCFAFLLFGVSFLNEGIVVEGSFWDAVPLISQVKSAYQAIKGDMEGARQTQDNFSRTNPFAVPIRGLVEHASGNHDEAKKTWTHFGKFSEGVLDSSPVMGHIKGGVHYAVGDTERGHQIMKSATRSAATIGAGLAAGIASGGNPVVGYAAGSAAGAAAGLAMDGVYTGIDSAIHNEYRPAGQVASSSKILTGKGSVGDFAEIVMNAVADGYPVPILTSSYEHKSKRFIRRRRGVLGSRTSEINLPHFTPTARLRRFDPKN